MITTNRCPGKFEGNRSQLLAEVVYNAMCDDDLGDVQDFGWYGLVKGNKYWFIIHEDSQGFVDVDHGASETMLPEWDKLQSEYSLFLEENDEL